MTKGNILKNKAGNATIIALGLAPLLLFGFYSVSTLLLSFAKQAATYRDSNVYKAVLDSAIVYTKYALKNKMCMNSQWMIDLGSTCDLKHSMNLYRLFIDSKAIHGLRAVNYADTTYDDSNILLKTITTTVVIDSMPSTHPLMEVIASTFKNTNEKPFSKIKFELNRVDDANWPRRGRETYVEIKVTLMPENILYSNLSSLTARAFVIVVPRELNYFSLIVPNNLDLSTSSVSSTTTGNFIVPVHAGTPDTYTGKGIQFESPVYVNGDVIIPESGSGKFAPVTFDQKLVLGGWNSALTSASSIKTPSGPYKPTTPGGVSDQFYSQLETVGGFNRGIEIDGERDIGLDIFAGIVTPAPISPDGMKECSVWGANASDLFHTRDADLLVRQVSKVSDKEYNYRLALSKLNVFFDQNLKPEFKLIPPHPATPGKSYQLVPYLPSMPGPFPTRTPSIFYVIVEAAENPPNKPVGYTGKKRLEFSAYYNTKVSFPFRDYVSSNHGVLTLTFSPHHVGSNKQPNIVNLNVQVSGEAKALGPLLQIKLVAYDVGYFAGRNRRDHLLAQPTGDLGHSRNVVLTYDVQTGILSPTGYAATMTTNGDHYLRADPDVATPAPTLPITTPSGATVTYPSYILPPYTQPASSMLSPGGFENFDFKAIRDRCEAGAIIGSVSFGGAAWVKDRFSNQTMTSWNFNPPGNVATKSPKHPKATKGNPNEPPKPDMSTPRDIIFNDLSNPKVSDAEHDAFYIYSIANNCIVEPTATIVIGFLVCNRLVIQPRSTPLKFIGSFVFNGIDIPATAVAAGITFRNIYHPQSIQDLTTTGVLRRHDGTQCPLKPTDATWIPVWWPKNDSVQNYNVDHCSPMILRTMANPFTWSKFSPDCGLVNPSDPSFSCMNMTEKFLIREVSHDYL